MITGNSPTDAAAATVGHPTASLDSTSATTTYHRLTVDGVGVFYREAGPKEAPTIVLLHGFPSSSREFDTLIPLLATRYHLIAPDFPGFGQSEAPPPSSYVYTFDNSVSYTHLDVYKRQVCVQIKPPSRTPATSAARRLIAPPE